ncbi:bifunctional diaminohydroxyphosphoribosylaminopyrimidine deaminase/5-amino-6-(5-phosphoribosylamino)uracil reductase RibD [Chryseobacterium sp. T1]
MTDQFYMQRCIDLANKAIGNTYPNPLVGSVIVYDNQIIGEGYHKKAGEPHAEINAINSVRNPKLLKEATIYVSLEPCSHFGKTPPCALKLKEIGFKKVVIGAMDYNEQVNGKGKKILEDASIEVVTGVLKEECEDLNKRFFTFHQKKRPYIILKWAQSGDGFMDKDYRPTQISNSLSKQYVHKMRSEEQAILVGKNTAINDNPSLTVREIVGNNPIRVLIDFNLDVSREFNIYNDEATTLVFNQIKEEKLDHIHFIKIEKENALNQIIKHLHTFSIQSIIIEGGSFTLKQFIEHNLWDEAYIFQNNNLKLENGTKAPKFNFEAIEELKLRDNSVSIYKNQNSI